MERLYRPLENEHPDKRQESTDQNDEFRPDDSIRSFNSNNMVAKSSNSPLRMRDSYTPVREVLDITHNLANSDYGSRSRSRSGYRNISRSPIQVNTSFEISQKNTENLWNEFKENLREGSATRQTKYNSNSTNYNPIKWEEVKQNLQQQNQQDYSPHARTTGLLTAHRHRVSSNSNVDTNIFNDTTKSEDKNRLLSEKCLTKLIKISGDNSSMPKSSLREDISFDRNTQVLSGFRIDSNRNIRNQASQFTFNSTDRMQSNEKK
jgi:hypothetical protein